MPDLEKKNGITETHNDFPVVGIGASAGGLGSLEAFFDHMLSSTGMSYAHR